MKDKAIVIETGEVFDVESHYSIKKMTLTIDLPDDLNESLSESLNGFEQEFEYKDTNDEEGDYYLLSNDKRYTKDELIVGLDNIREYKLKNIL